MVASGNLGFYSFLYHVELICFSHLGKFLIFKSRRLNSSKSRITFYDVIARLEKVFWRQKMTHSFLSIFVSAWGNIIVELCLRHAHTTFVILRKTSLQAATWFAILWTNNFFTQNFVNLGLFWFENMENHSDTVMPKKSMYVLWIITLGSRGLTMYNSKVTVFSWGQKKLFLFSFLTGYYSRFVLSSPFVIIVIVSLLIAFLSFPSGLLFYFCSTSLRSFCLASILLLSASSLVYHNISVVVAAVYDNNSNLF